jgi:hypothetical protein
MSYQPRRRRPGDGDTRTGRALDSAVERESATTRDSLSRRAAAPASTGQVFAERRLIGNFEVTPPAEATFLPDGRLAIKTMGSVMGYGARRATYARVRCLKCNRTWDVGKALDKADAHTRVVINHTRRACLIQQLANTRS